MLSRAVMPIREFANFLVCCLSAWLLFVTATPASASTPHYVFAHYMVCYSDYGATVRGYEHDIQDAQAAGIDGFALDVGEWNGPDTYYNTNVELMYEAAESLTNGFKLFFSVDMQNTNEIVQMISSYAHRTNSFYYNGGLVISTYGAPGFFWTNGVFKPLQTMGISNIFFIPDFPAENAGWPTVAGANAVLATYTFLNGLFVWVSGTAWDVTNLDSTYYSACQTQGKLFMASCSPTYWGCNQTTAGRSYFDTLGGEGLVNEWNWIIQHQPDWVEIVTWNDFSEGTYTSPISNPGQYEAQVQMPVRYSHAGYLELSKRYISWYKTGVPPATNQDALYYFYRIHSKNAIATNDIPVTYFMVGSAPGIIQDAIYHTLFLTAPAQLNVVSGTNSVVYSLGAGMQQLSTPFAPGTQTFTLTRNGTQVLSVQGPQILSQITNYDYFTVSGFAYGLSAPTSLKAKP